MKEEEEEEEDKRDERKNAKSKRRHHEEWKDPPRKAFKGAGFSEPPRTKGGRGEESSSYESEGEPEENADETDERESDDEKRALICEITREGKVARRKKRCEREDIAGTDPVMEKRRRRNGRIARRPTEVVTEDHLARPHQKSGRQKDAGRRRLPECLLGWVVFSKGTLLEISPPQVGGLCKEVPREVGGPAVEAHGERNRVLGVPKRNRLNEGAATSGGAHVYSHDATPSGQMDASHSARVEGEYNAPGHDDQRERSRSVRHSPENQGAGKIRGRRELVAPSQTLGIGGSGGRSPSRSRGRRYDA